MLLKYPRTPHIEGSRRQPGDEDMDFLPLAALRQRHVVIAEKVDGANVGISFDAAGRLLLQSRGHYLTGGWRERHYELFKQWAHTNAAALHERLADRYIVYGEWLYAKHTLLYDVLPHYFLEFDAFDTSGQQFLDTARRRSLLDGLPIVCVPALFSGVVQDTRKVLSLLGPSPYKTDGWRDELRLQARRLQLDDVQIMLATDNSRLMEGLYMKVEEQGRVALRAKYVRPDFRSRVVEPETHWLARPIVPNLLRPGVDVFVL